MKRVIEETKKRVCTICWRTFKPFHNEDICRECMNQMVESSKAKEVKHV